MVGQQYRNGIRRDNSVQLFALVGVLGLLASGFLAFDGAALANEEPASGTILTPILRGSIDVAASRATLEPLKHQGIESTAKRLEWLISKVPIDPSEEAEAARQLDLARVQSHPTQSPGKELTEVFEMLIRTLPEPMKPREFTFSLTIAEVPEANTYTSGAGRIWITAPMLKSIDRQPGRRPMLAFIIAHELGHVCLGHTASGIQAMKIAELAKGRLDQGEVDRKLLNVLLGTTIDTTTRLVCFLYTHEQEYEADLFALQLCRNAGFDPQDSLDLLRLLALMANPRLSEAKIARAETQNDPDIVRRLVRSHPAALLRLKRLQMEMDGQPDKADDYGLFAYDPKDDSFHRAPDRSILPSQEAIVFVHGMEGDRKSYRELLAEAGSRFDGQHRPLLVFLYPNHDSLAKCGVFLRHEMDRVCEGAAQNVDFVCHSAGGLVFRWYAEITEGRFRRAILQATPHKGSSLATLQPLVEMARIWPVLAQHLPVNEALLKLVHDGKGQVMRDLAPNSLFLCYLAAHGDKKRIAERYILFRGCVMGSKTAFLFSRAFDLAKTKLRPEIAAAIDEPAMRGVVLRLFDRVKVPPEITHGDCIVSMDSAVVEGAVVYDTRCDHLAIKEDAKVAEEVLRLLDQN